MKGSEQFKKDVEGYLEDRFLHDELFARYYENPKKNIDDCVTYILNTVQKSGVNGFTDAEIYGMAVHYYEEQDIDVGKTINCDVVVNHKVELTPEEIEQARQDAIRKVQEDNERRMTMKTKPKNVINPINVQSSLF